MTTLLRNFTSIKFQKKILDFLYLVIISLPFICIASIVIYIFRVMDSIGGWPDSDRFYSGVTPFDFHYEVTIYLLHAFGISLFFVPIFHFIYKFFFQSRPIILFRFYKIGWVSLLFLYFVPKINIVMWFLFLD